MVLIMVSGVGRSQWEEPKESETVCQLVGKSAVERRIVYHSSVYDTSVRLAYRTVGGQMRTVCPTITSYEMGEDVRYRYQAELTDLMHEADYEYGVMRDGEVMKWYTFSTREKAYRAVVFTDSQCAGDYRAWQETVRSACEREGTCMLCIHLGDLVDCGASPYQWRRWFNGVGEVIASCAFAPVMGNHEDYDEAWQMCLPRLYRALFPVRDESDDELNGYVYSFDYGEVHYAVLDTQAEELVQWKRDWAALQTAWLTDDLARSKARWKVILCHKPFLESDGTLTEHGKCWLPICQAYGVQLIVSGHHHIYTHNHRGGIVMITAGVSGDGLGYEVDEEVKYDVARRCDMMNYLTLDVGEKGLKVRAVQVDGSVIDEVELMR